MFHKHWEKIFLAIAAFFWNGCGDNASSSDVRGTCSFSGGACPEYGVDMYVCENPEDFQSPDSSKCTFYRRDPCTDFYNCDDGLSCYKDEGETFFTCFDEQDNVTKYNEDEFKAMYDVKEPEDVFEDEPTLNKTIDGSSSSVQEQSSSSEPIDTTQVLCYNESIENEENETLEIIECTDGNKYLRDPTIYRLYPDRLPKIPDNIKTTFPTPGSSGASNCQWDVICHDIPIMDEQGYIRNAGGCNQGIHCPDKP